MKEPKRLIIETDVYSDVDDIGALAVAHHYADDGLAELLSIGVNTPSTHGTGAVRVVNGYFGRHVPVGALFPRDESVFDQDYAKFLCETYAAPADLAPPEDAVTVHRRALAGAPDASVTVLSIGFLHNLGRLLKSAPDDDSPLTGSALVERKVEHLVVMGGEFPSGLEFNLSQFPQNARSTVADWPTPIDFLGWEVGASVITGRKISTRGAEDVIGSAYRHFSGAGGGRESCDLLTVEVAVEGLGSHYRYSPPGRVQIDESGVTSFHLDPAGSHRYVMLAAGVDQIAAHIDSILEREPATHLHEKAFDQEFAIDGNN